MLKRNSFTRRLTLCGMMVALGVLLSRFAQFEFTLGGIRSMEFGLGQMPVLFIGVILGPVYGGMVGAAIDIIGVFVKNGGALNPAFTLSAALYGIIPGLIFSKKHQVPYWKLLLTTYISHFITSTVLNTLFIHIFYSIPLVALLLQRLITFAFEPLLITTVAHLLLRASKQAGYIDFNTQKINIGSTKKA